MSVPGVAVIVLSYNRPRMLLEALESVVGASEIIVVDDGSDFDVVEHLYDQSDAGQDWPTWNRAPLRFVRAAPQPLAERLARPRMARLINRALTLAGQPIIAYLCDDDLFAPEWLPSVAAWFGTFPQEPWVRGDWYAWQDGTPPTRERLADMDARQMTTGNFAHRLSVVTEHGLRWDEHGQVMPVWNAAGEYAGVADVPLDQSVGPRAVGDDPFLWRAHLAGIIDAYHVPHCGAAAGWRRLHAHNAALYTREGWRYADDAPTLFKDRWLE